MDRSLQSALEKRSRMGAWQSRVYRLERGYLSVWTDVTSVAAQEQPSRTECLFQEGQVAVLTDQAERRFKLDFPWDGAKTLSLRANDITMKKAWMDVLRAALKEIALQIQGTGSVFALGGAAQHRVDEAYEEAAYLKTNRFLAAYVVDEENRASYINDLLNENFYQLGDRAGGGQEVHKACAGAHASIDELLALAEDFKEEMLGIQELKRGIRGGEVSGGLNPAVAAPKIQRFCEEYLALVGRLVSSRLMLELSPFMDTSVAGTNGAPTSATRDELVSTRKQIDEMYSASEKLVVSGTRDWVMDIRGSFLDCSALLQASAKPLPVPKVEEAPADPPADLPLPPQTPEPPSPIPTAKRSSMTFISGAFAAAKAAATKGPGAEKGNSALEGGHAEATRDAGPDGGGSPTGKSMVARIGGAGAMSMRAFRRSSRTDKDVYAEKTPHPSGPQSSLPSPPRAGNDDPGFVASSVQVRSPESRAVTGAAEGATEQRERSSLFDGSSRSPNTSPRNENASTFASKGFPPSSSPPSRQSGLGGRADSSSLPIIDSTGPFGRADSSSLPIVDSMGPFGRADSANAGAQGTGSVVGGSAAVPASKGGRKGRRAFAGGLWGGGGGAVNPDGAASAGSGRDLPVDQGDALVAPPASGAVEDTAGDTQKPKPSGGGKRRFAGGGFGAQPPSASSALSSNDGQAYPRSVAAEHTARGGGGVTNANRGVPASAKSGGSGWDRPKQAVHEVAGAATSPAWAAESNDNDVPAWATGGVASSTGGKKQSNTAASNGFGLAPPSMEEQGQEEARNSPFLNKGGDAPPVRRPSQRRPGAGSGGSRRAFGGGQSLF